jgi:hypothetical protein
MAQSLSHKLCFQHQGKTVCTTPSGSGIFILSCPQVSPAATHIDPLRGLFDTVIKYMDQEEHQRFVSFQEEVKKLLVKHGVEFNEDYLWD